jgi:hypothetical protein
MIQSCAYCQESIPPDSRKRFHRKFCSDDCYLASRRKSAEVIFFSSTDFWANSHGCWLWKLPVNNQGYAHIWLWDTQRKIKAHRWSYEYWRGKIPESLVVDHLCRIHHCVNPWHLEPVTPRENILRGEGLAAQQAKRMHCKRGHALTEENIYHNPRFPRSRWCRLCKIMAAAARDYKAAYQRRKAKAHEKDRREGKT